MSNLQILLFHDVTVQKIWYHSDSNNLSSIINNFGDLLVFHANHILAIDLAKKSI